MSRSAKRLRFSRVTRYKRRPTKCSRNYEASHPPRCGSSKHAKPDLKTLDYIHRAKTAALITASLVSGGLYGGGDDDQITRLRTFGESIGLAFQIVDDVLDVTQTSEQLGKTAGKDSAAEKTTYPALFGIEESIKRADALVERGCERLDSFGERATSLKGLARFLVERKK
jgi:geranylgeranyl diphosphate synthase, type II